VIVNEHSQAFVIVTQQRVGIGLATHSQRLACSRNWQRQNGNGLQGRGMFGQRSVM
jgi:hypothetical protein